MRRWKKRQVGEGFTSGVLEYMEQLRSEGRYSSAKSYRDALGSITRFLGKRSIAYRDITLSCLHRYQSYLLGQGRSWNTVSTYLRRVRHIYYRGVGKGAAPYVRRLFREVFTGVESRRKRALSAAEMCRLMTARVDDPSLRRTQLSLSLMFLYGGMAFVDFAHLRPGDISEGCLEYRRQKTGTSLRLSLPEEAERLSSELSAGVLPGSAYLYPFLSGACEGEAAYREYLSALARFNRDLRLLARAVGVTSPVSSYTIRHTFATRLRELDVSIEVISELMGHKSIKTTQIYLRSFSLDRLSAENTACFNSVYHNSAAG